MPIIKAAKKHLRSSKKKAGYNKAHTLKVKELIKKTRKLIQEGKTSEAKKQLTAIQKAVDKAVKTKAIKTNTGNRKKSRIAKAIKKSSKK